MNGWRIIWVAGGALAVWTSVWSTQAQTTSPYTMPVATQSRDAAPNRADSVVAPVSHENNQITEDEIPVSAPPPDRLLELTPGKEKNWIEMTPEEILGLPPLAKATDVKSSENSLKSFNRSPLQDLLAERHSSQQYLLPGDGSREHGIGEDPNNSERLDSTGSRRPETMPSVMSMASPLNRLLEGARSSFSQESSDGELNSLFHASKASQSAVAQAAAEADMEAFRQMLNPSQPDKPEGASSGAVKMAAVDPDVDRAPAKYNPNGNTFAPQDDGINRPKRLTALPTATTLNPNLNPATPPAWAPQPPPWTLKTPQLFVEPQRKF